MTSEQALHHELESQFILRLPEAPATMLSDCLKSGSSGLKDRLNLKMEPDGRHGTLLFDNYSLPAKLVDLPCIIESQKTIDKKTVYKTADISQMLLCELEEQDVDESDPEKAAKAKKKELKIDRKFHYPHGITPPLKNVRKRRFRKVLKKKYSDQPELEKEVRRLLRADYEAKHVSWEVIDEEEDKSREGGGKDILMQGSKTNEDPVSRGGSGQTAFELFGDNFSDSDAEDEDGGDESRMSMDDDSQSRLSDSCASSQDQTKEKKGSSYATCFTQEMFASPESELTNSPEKSPKKRGRASSSSSNGKSKVLTKDELRTHLEKLKQELTEISARHQITETELSGIDNAALRRRLVTVLGKLEDDQREKEREIQEVENRLSSE